MSIFTEADYHPFQSEPPKPKEIVRGDVKSPEAPKPPYQSLHSLYVTEYPLEAQSHIMGSQTDLDYQPLETPTGYRREDLPSGAIRLIREKAGVVISPELPATPGATERPLSPIQSMVSRFIGKVSLPAFGGSLNLGGAR